MDDLIAEKPLSSVWVLTVRTSLPGTFDDYDDIKPETFTFLSFADARAKFRGILSGISHSNVIFNDEGEITKFKACIDNIQVIKLKNESEDSEFGGVRTLKPQILLDYYNAVKSIFAGKDIEYSLDNGKYCYYPYYSIVAKNGVVAFSGEETPEGNNQYIKTNAFKMVEEKDYHMKIRDGFSGTIIEVPSLLEVDLKKVDIG